MKHFDFRLFTCLKNIFSEAYQIFLHCRLFHDKLMITILEAGTLWIMDKSLSFEGLQLHWNSTYTSAANR